MNNVRNKRGFTLVEAVIALTVIITVSATALVVIMNSISLRFAEINRAEAQNFAENVWECFQAANEDGLTSQEKTEKFFDLVEFAEGAEWTEKGESVYRYDSEERRIAADLTVRYGDELSEFTIEMFDDEGQSIVSFSYEIGKRGST